MILYAKSQREETAMYTEWGISHYVVEEPEFVILYIRQAQAEKYSDTHKRN